MNRTRAEIVAARHPRCSWTAQELDAAVAARFPNDPVDLVALADAWLADASLDAPTLRQCAYLLAAVAGVNRAALALAPRDALDDVKGRIP